MVSPFIITIFLGAQLLDFPDHFLPTWIKLFKEYPILYEGDSESVKSKFKELSQEPDSCIMVAHTHEHTMAGFIYGVPLKVYPAYEKLFQENGRDSSLCYHIKDLIIMKECRKQGMATKLCKKLKKRIKKLGYTKMSLGIIEHEGDHPLKPDDYCDPKLFWSKQGFYPTSMVVKKSWHTLMDDKGTLEWHEHNIHFWINDTLDN